MYTTVDSRFIDKPRVRPWGQEDVCIEFGPFIAVVRSEADIDALMVVAAESREMLRTRQGRAAVEAKRLLSPPVTAGSKPAPAAHVCECGHYEAYHIGAVRGDDNPGPCTVCVTCDTYEAKS